MREKICLIGPCGGGAIPMNGASAKNYQMVNFMRMKSFDLVVIDTERWRRNPFVLVRLLWIILFCPQYKLIIATNNMSGYRLLWIMAKLSLHRHIIYWVIGGSIANWLKEGKVPIAPYKYVTWFIVEGRKMLTTLSELGFKNNVLYVPNFKAVDFIPKKHIKKGNKIKFVFLSRIIPEKGCELIFEANVNLLKKCSNFTIDFYGPIDLQYQKRFNEQLKRFTNVSYKGFLNLNQVENYQVLSLYDVMLFPTFWDGEGFPGVIIDAFIAGLPVIASDWSLNADIIEDGKTGLIMEKLTVQSLEKQMLLCITHPELIQIMSENSQCMARNYDIHHLLSEELFEKIGLL